MNRRGYWSVRRRLDRSIRQSLIRNSPEKNVSSARYLVQPCRDHSRKCLSLCPCICPRMYTNKPLTHRLSLDPSRQFQNLVLVLSSHPRVPISNLESLKVPSSNFDARSVVPGVQPGGKIGRLKETGIHFSGSRGRRAKYERRAVSC